MPKLTREQQIQKRFNQLKTLSKSKKRPNSTVLTDEQLWKQAEEGIDDKAKYDEINIESFFRDAKEKKLAREFLAKYLTDYAIETVSDRHTLCQLIYLEVINNRLQKALNDCQHQTNAIPSNLVDLIHKNIKEITALKTSLGINKSKNKSDDSEQKDAHNFLQRVTKKYKQWLSEQDQVSRTLTCPHCCKFVLLRIKTDIWETQKHPFIKDRIFCNPKIIDLYKQGRITSKEVEEIFEAGQGYTEWLLKKWDQNDKNKTDVITNLKDDKNEESIASDNPTDDKSGLLNDEQTKPDSVI